MKGIFLDKKIYMVAVSSLLAILSVQLALAIDTGSGIGIDITTEGFEPLIWMCDSRVVFDDPVEQGRLIDLDWCFQNWQYRKNITIDSNQIPEDLDNFPVLINITNQDLADNAQADGDDILFADENCQKLAHEIEFYNDSNGHLVAWVKVDVSGSSDKKIGMYYGNAAAPNQQNPGTVWNPHAGVWHLAETGVGTRFDSTANNNDGFPQNYDGDEAVTGQIDGADDFDGVDDFIEAGNNSVLNFERTDLISGSAWIRTSADGTDKVIMSRRQAADTRGYVFYVNSANRLEVVLQNTNANRVRTAGSTDILQGAWHYVAFTYSGNSSADGVKLYVDGVRETEVIVQDTLSATIQSTGNFEIGDQSVLSLPMSGVIDEVRVSDKERNASWILASYNNQNDPVGFHIVGPQEEIADELQLVERIENYAFEGEQIQWEVLVMDKNKIEQIQDVVGTVGVQQGAGNPIEVECSRIDKLNDGDDLPDSCNARILEEKLEFFDEETMDFYRCVFTVETQASMYGENFITIQVTTGDVNATIDENEYWFLNPTVALTIMGGLTFADVRPGTVSYSDTIIVTNDADPGSGVLLDMFISGTDFFDPANGGTKCPTTNHLKLSQDLRSRANLGPGIASGPSQTAVCNADDISGGLSSVDNNDHLCYYATSGAYSTFANPNADAEGYRPIVYSDSFTRDFYNDAEIIYNGLLPFGFSAGNVLSPGADIALTFKLGLPEPCIGDFSDGDVFFWGEAI